MNFPRPSRLAALGSKDSVWVEFGALAEEHGAVKMGQGFPNWETPTFVKDALVRAVQNDFNQYTRSQGHSRLVKKLAEVYSGRFGRPVDAMKEVFVGVGASETLMAAMHGLLEEDDEVILIEPFFDLYKPNVMLAGAKPVYVPLTFENDVFQLEMNKLRSAMTSRTRAIVLNSPNNPTGKVYSEKELKEIATILKDFPRCLVITDEVYEHQVYPPAKHVYAASIPELAHKTLTVSSAGKTFSCTGWKIGWAIGDSQLINNIAFQHQWVSFTTPTPLQEAIAEALEVAETPFEGHQSYYEWLSSMYLKKRDLLVKCLTDAGLEAIIPPDGGFFVMANVENLFKHVPEKFYEGGVDADWALARWLTVEAKVSAIPSSAFYCEEHKSHAKFLRFAFCKNDEDIELCGSRLTSFLQRYK